MRASRRRDDALRERAMKSAASMNSLSYTLKMRMPFGVLGVREKAGRICAIDYLPSRTTELPPQTAVARKAADQFDAYLADPRWKFELPCAFQASDFENDVWDAIRRIPPGQVRTYGDIAKQVRSIPRAVGGACGRNPLPLIIPCHRVVAAGGIGGFMGGRDDDPLAIKRWLLSHEGVLA
jgi:methylated-DNA-[protein]-cysteine S-methyltransferase